MIIPGKVTPRRVVAWDGHDRESREHTTLADTAGLCCLSSVIALHRPTPSNLHPRLLRLSYSLHRQERTIDQSQAHLLAIDLSSAVIIFTLTSYELQGNQKRGNLSSGRSPELKLPIDSARVNTSWQATM